MSWPAAVVYRVPVEHLKTAVDESAEIFHLLGWNQTEAFAMGVAATAGAICLREGGTFKRDLEAVVAAIDDRLAKEIA